MNEVAAVGTDREKIIAAAKYDLNIFASICIPEVFEFDFPPVFLAVWQLLTDGANKEVSQERLAIGLPRGFGKTLLLKLFTVWLAIYSSRRFVIIVCNTATLAEMFLADVSDILDAPNVLRLWGDWRLGMSKDTGPLKKFSFANRPVTFAALGSGSSLRGLSLKLVRPDCMIMDDMQSKEEAESPQIAESLLVWMLGTLLKANNKRRCQFVFVANMYPYDGSILKKLKTNPAWYSFICGAILADGESIWPELRSVEDLLDELENDISMGHPEIFYSEVMNDEEAGNKAGVDITKINYWLTDTSDGGMPLEPEAGFVIIDPSVGKRKGDKVGIGAVLIFSGIPVLWDLRIGAFNPKEQIQQCFELCAQYGLMALLVESTAYQATLVFWMEEARRRYGLMGLRILEIYPGINTKVSRILNALKQVTAQQAQLMVHPRVKSALIHQVVHYNPMKSKNVDEILDILAYCYPAISQFGIMLLCPFEVTIESKATFSDDLQLAF